MKPFLGKSTLESYQWNKIPQMSSLVLLGQHNSEKQWPDTFFLPFHIRLSIPSLTPFLFKGLCSRLEQCYVWREVICVMGSSRITFRQWGCNFTIDLHVGGSIYGNYLLPLPVWTLTVPYSAVNSIAWCWARACISKMYICITLNIPISRYMQTNIYHMI